MKPLAKPPCVFCFAKANYILRNVEPGHSAISACWRCTQFVEAIGGDAIEESVWYTPPTKTERKAAVRLAAKILKEGRGD